MRISSDQAQPHASTRCLVRGVILIAVAAAVVVVVSITQGQQQAATSLLRIKKSASSTQMGEACNKKLARVLDDEKKTRVLDSFQLLPNAKLFTGQDVVGTDAKDARQDLSIRASVSSHLEEQHKFARLVDGKYMFLFSNNMVVTADEKSCAIESVYMPTADGSYHPRIMKLAGRAKLVAQDSKKKKAKACLRRDQPCKNKRASCCKGMWCKRIYVVTGCLKSTKRRVGRKCERCCPPSNCRWLYRPLCLKKRWSLKTVCSY